MVDENGIGTGLAGRLKFAENCMTEMLKKVLKSERILQDIATLDESSWRYELSADTELHRQAGETLLELEARIEGLTNHHEDSTLKLLERIVALERELERLAPAEDHNPTPLPDSFVRDANGEPLYERTNYDKPESDEYVDTQIEAYTDSRAIARRLFHSCAPDGAMLGSRYPGWHGPAITPAISLELGDLREQAIDRHEDYCEFRESLANCATGGAEARLSHELAAKAARAERRYQEALANAKQLDDIPF